MIRQPGEVVAVIVRIDSEGRGHAADPQGPLRRDRQGELGDRHIGHAEPGDPHHLIADEHRERHQRRALDQRQRTIVKVASAIVKQQEGFFLHGVAHMRPLTLRQVAEEIGMHESTVSRVTSNKYLSCPRGLFELKYFFSSGISATDGDGAVSAEAVKSRIKAMIEGEDARAILSDETIAQKLSAEGHDIARRTVVKYREAMGYGSSVQRRRQKALAG